MSKSALSAFATLEALVAEDAEKPVTMDVQKLSAAIQDRAKISAILFYGSGMWAGSSDDIVYDFYVLVENYGDFNSNLGSAILGSCLPPNVYYMEIEEAERTLRCKFALMRKDQFIKAASGRALTPQIWARFSQPCRIIYNADADTSTLTRALAESVLTFHRTALPLTPQNEPLKQIWLRGLQATYSAELRSEKPDRPERIYASDAESFNRRSELAIALLEGIARGSKWAPIRNLGKRPVQKFINFCRLIKASFTFDGGVDYVLWKIGRQSGVVLTATDFQRRHPLIGAWPLLWSLWRKGGFR